MLRSLRATGSQSWLNGSFPVGRSFRPFSSVLFGGLRQRSNRPRRSSKSTWMPPSSPRHNWLPAIGCGSWNRRKGPIPTITRQLSICLRTRWVRPFLHYPRSNPSSIDPSRSKRNYTAIKIFPSPIVSISSAFENSGQATIPAPSPISRGPGRSNSTLPPPLHL